MMHKKLFTLAATLLLSSSVVVAEDSRPKSPEGTASTQIGEAWVDVTYSRPILRGRQGIFGAGKEYGATVNGGADFWRAGANATTKIKTEVDLMVGGKKVPAGEYGIVIGLNEKAWTLVLTSQESMDTWQGREAVEKGVLWGSYGYKPEFDVTRASMDLAKLGHSVDQMTIGFVDVSDSGATLAIWWDNTQATVRLKVAK